MYTLCSRRQFLYSKGKLGPAHFLVTDELVDVLLTPLLTIYILLYMCINIWSIYLSIYLCIYLSILIPPPLLVCVGGVSMGCCSCLVRVCRCRGCCSLLVCVCVTCWSFTLPPLFILAWAAFLLLLPTPLPSFICSFFLRVFWCRGFCSLLVCLCVTCCSFSPPPLYIQVTDELVDVLLTPLSIYLSIFAYSYLMARLE